MNNNSLQNPLKKIICLAGCANRGKTSVLKSLAQSNKFKLINKNDIRNGDFNYCVKYNNKLIAITTNGDSGKAIKEGVNYCIEKSCEIWVTALKTTNPQALKELNNHPGSNIIIVVKKLGKKDNLNSNSYSKSDNCYVNELFKIIERCVQELQPIASIHP